MKKASTQSILATYHKRARFWAAILGRLPGVAAIFLSGSLAKGKGSETSDIDFFIIAYPNRLWSARFFVFITLKLFGRLAKPHRHAGNICPNHFISAAHLEIQEKDPYSAHLFTALKALYDPHNLFPHFVQANQHWVKNFQTHFTAPPAKTPYHPPKSYIPQILEDVLAFFQKKRITSQKAFHDPAARIVLNSKELRFHPKPKAPSFNKDYENKED